LIFYTVLKAGANPEILAGVSERSLRLPGV